MQGRLQVNGQTQAANSQSQDGPRDPGRLCDFCGDRVSTVRRVALDWGYDRLQKVHHEQYSCSSCFDLKEERRLGMSRR